MQLGACCLALWYTLWVVLPESVTGFLPSNVRSVLSSREATLSPLSTPNAKTPAEDSQALLEALLGGEGSSLNVGDTIERLRQAQVTFDPAECFNGPLYIVLHQQGPKPRWEKIGSFAPGQKQINRQGQKYVYKTQTKDYDLVNYAEIFGKGM